MVNLKLKCKCLRYENTESGDVLRVVSDPVCFLSGVISHNSSGILVCTCDSQALTDLGEVAYVSHIAQSD